MAADQLLASYRLELHGPPPSAHASYANLVTVRAVGLSLTFLHETQENITDVLPEGYRVCIRPAENPGSSGKGTPCQ